MNTETVTWVTSCADLRIGETIKAMINGRVLVRGEVVETMLEQGLLWIREEALGNRRLLDMSEMEILRVLKAGPWPLGTAMV